MDLTIQIDETRFKDVLDKELNAFSKEELHDIIREAIITYLKDNNSVEKLLFEEEIGYYSDHKKVPTAIARNLLSSIDISDECKDITIEIANQLKNNACNIMADIFAKSFAKSILDGLNKDNWLESSITPIVYNGITNHEHYRHNNN